MAFSSIIFVFAFLPLVFLLYCLIPSIRRKNALLIAASLLFYAFGEPIYILLMLFSTLFNYVLARLLARRRTRAVLVTAVAVNIGLLCFFKYTAFFLSAVNGLLRLQLPVPQIALPIGISFFTFQALSYVIDVYRGEVEAQRSYWKVLLYISFFPQLIAGPIVKYKDIALQIDRRRFDLRDAAFGMRRFIFGLAKKVLIANAMAAAADQIFSHSPAELNLLSAWIGAVSYTLQIYFDFSAYSDMAIGLGRMFGFVLRENFLFPYRSVSVKEFWRRWHISLSSWFKDYVYIPLGGNRRGPVRTGLNKLLVFFLTGLWHGANWTFVAWGLFHGAFSFLEEFMPRLRRLPRALGHLYTMLEVCVGFVIFRADSLSYALRYLGRMFAGSAFSPAANAMALAQLTPYYLFMLALALFFCGPAEDLVQTLRAPGEGTRTLSEREVLSQTLLFVCAFLLLFWCLIRLSGGSYNPFIYFRF